MMFLHHNRPDFHINVASDMFLKAFETPESPVVAANETSALTLIASKSKEGSGWKATALDQVLNQMPQRVAIVEVQIINFPPQLQGVH